MDKLEHVFIFPEFNESECWSQRGEKAGEVRKPDESQKRGGAAGIVLAEITPSLIATAERSLPGSQAQCGAAQSAACDKQKVPLTCSCLTGSLSASSTLSFGLTHFKKKKKKKRFPGQLHYNTSNG